MVLIATTAAGMMLSRCRAAIAAAALTGCLLSLPDTVTMIRSNIAGHATPDGSVFAQAPELWTAVRRYAPPAARVANNPLYLQDLTPWPVNASWALLADRSSCFAGRELALAFASLPAERREVINTQFIRVFDGKAQAGRNIDELAKTFACVVLADRLAFCRFSYLSRAFRRPSACGVPTGFSSSSCRSASASEWRRSRSRRPSCTSPP